MYISQLFIHSSVDGHFHCLHVLVIVNKAAVNVGLSVSFQISVLFFPEYVPRSGIAGSYGSSIFSFFEEPPYSFPHCYHFGLECALCSVSLTSEILPL